MTVPHELCVRLNTGWYSARQSHDVSEILHPPDRLPLARRGTMAVAEDDEPDPLSTETGCDSAAIPGF